jgi:hypothetical protein
MVDARTEGGFGAELKREGASSEKNRVVSVIRRILDAEFRAGTAESVLAVPEACPGIAIRGRGSIAA